MANGRTPRPPAPGPLVSPNFLAIEEAVANVTFPISKRELMDQMGDGTAIFNGSNVDLHDLIRDLNDDFFESEDEFRVALEMEYAGILRGAEETEDVPAALPTGPQTTWQADVGPGAAGGSDEYVEPHDSV